jgi:hypothetical protein
LSKSDFKRGHECPFKLKYARLGYPSTRASDPAAAFFAQGGFMVEALAHAVLSEDPRVEFEKTLAHGPFHARVDAFMETEESIVLTEIKSGSYDSSKSEAKVNPDYLLDIAFQVMVARLAFPGRRISARLCMVDASKSSSIEAIFSNIEILEGVVDKSQPRAVYRGGVDRLRKDHFLVIVDVDDLVEDLIPEVMTEARVLVDFLAGQRPDIEPKLAISTCKTCEFRVRDAKPSGFDECWGGGGDQALSIDLYSIGRNAALQNSIRSSWSEGKRSLSDIPWSLLQGDKVIDAARRNQHRAATSGQEYVDPDLRSTLENLVFPIHFVDFETSAIPVPYFPGMKPYQSVMFQFSVHRVDTPDSRVLEHSEWIDLDNVLPTRQFLLHLREQVGESGSIVTWSNHEVSKVKEAARYLRSIDLLEADLADWVDGFVGVVAKDSPGRVVDFNMLSRSFFAHPKMNGSHSIKDVLDAIWSGSDHLWNHPWFAEYVVIGDDGVPIDPYRALVRRNPADLGLLSGSDDDGLAVNQGVAAMKAYQALLFGKHRNDVDYARRLKRSLLDYCKLDTAAMVMVWMHWRHRLGLVT